jgi:hypothetical protein
VLTKQLDILDDIPWVEGNLPTGHRITARTGLPSPEWRRLNQGIDPKKSSTAQFEEVCGMLDATSRVDKNLADLNGNTAAFRFSEDKAMLEGYSQKVATSLFYDSAVTDTASVHGLSARYAATTGYTASSYVLKKGTTTTTGCHSVWLITWAPDRIFGIFPKGTKAGLSQDDMGVILTNDANSKQFRAYCTYYQWQLGWAVQDYRYACRMQWDTDDGTAFADTAKTMYLALQEMLGTVYKVEASSRFYMDRTSFNKLSAQLASNSADYLRWITDSNGRPLASFLGVPIRITDALVSESAYA